MLKHLPWSELAAILRLARLALSRGLPSDEYFATWGNKARNEALRARGKELIEAGLQNSAQALFEVGFERPESPLVTPKDCDPSSDGSLTSGSWYDWSGGMEWQDADIGQGAQFPEQIDQFRMPRHHFLRLAVHEVEENALPGWRGWTIDRD